MKFLETLFLIAPLTVALRLDRRGKAVYDGYKVLRVTPASDVATFEAHVESLEAVDLTHNHGDAEDAQFDIAVPPESLSAFDALNWTSQVLSDDLGADIALEGDLAEYPGSSGRSGHLKCLSVHGRALTVCRIRIGSERCCSSKLVVVQCVSCLR